MSNKLVAYFSAGGLGNKVQALALYCPGALVRDGKLLNGHQDARMLKAWADSL